MVSDSQSIGRPERREYQDRGVRDILRAIDDGRRPLYVLPTGAGKTVVAARVTQALIQYGRRVHFWVHRTELVDQAVATLRAALPWEAIGQIRPGVAMDPAALLQVAMVQTLARRVKAADVPRPDVVFVDEAHHARAATWESLLAWCPGAKVVGLTATPSRLDGKGLGEHFDTMIEGPGIGELVEGRYLAPTRTLVPSRAQVIEWRRDRESVTVGDAVRAYQEHTPGASAIFFGWDVRHSKEVAAAFRDAEVKAVHVDGKTPAAQRLAAMDLLRSGDVDVVCNHDIISEGFDAPGVECVIIGAPTASVVRYMQRGGRAMRPGAAKVATIIDLAGIAHYFGPVDKPREWTLADGAIKPGGVLPIAPEDIRKDRKPLGMVECELREVGEWEGVTEGLLSTSQAADRWNMKRATVLARVRARGLRPVIKLGSGPTRYYRAEDMDSIRGGLLSRKDLRAQFGVGDVSLNHLLSTYGIEAVGMGAGGGYGFDPDAIRKIDVVTASAAMSMGIVSTVLRTLSPVTGGGPGRERLFRRDEVVALAASESTKRRLLTFPMAASRLGINVENAHKLLADVSPADVRKGGKGDIRLFRAEDVDEAFGAWIPLAEITERWGYTENTIKTKWTQVATGFYDRQNVEKDMATLLADAEGMMSTREVATRYGVTGGTVRNRMKGFAAVVVKSSKRGIGGKHYRPDDVEKAFQDRLIAERTKGGTR